MTISQAVRTLRAHLRETQQVFATNLKMSISSLQNYEQDRTPEPKQLLIFYRAAEKAGRMDLAYVFLRAAREALGLDIQWHYSGSALRLRELNPDDPQSRYELLALEALERCLQGGAFYEDITPTVISALALAVERQAAELESKRDRENAEWFAEESVRRGYATKVDGRVMWEPRIFRGRKPKRLFPEIPIQQPARRGRRKK